MALDEAPSPTVFLLDIVLEDQFKLRQAIIGSIIPLVVLIPVA